MPRLILLAALLAVMPATASDSRIRPGVWAASQPDALPLPTRGYQAYLTGEMHGVQENAEFQLQYLELLHRTSGLRDIAIEERGVFEKDAQAFIDGRSDSLPPSLCLRIDLLEGIRKLNAQLPQDARIRVHLTDIDSPAGAIRRHLAELQKQIGAAVPVPEESALRGHGIEAVEKLKRSTSDSATQSELRTVELSIRALQQGLEFDVGPPKGSPYLEPREEAVARNIVDLIRLRGTPSLLVVYGLDHVSRTQRKDGGPDRNQPFPPMALRLEQAGIRIFTAMTLPLTGRTFWRGQSSEVYWTASDAHLASGETLVKVLASAPAGSRLFIDPKREHVRLPADDMMKMEVDGILLFPTGVPMRNRCVARP